MFKAKVTVKDTEPENTSLIREADSGTDVFPHFQMITEFLFILKTRLKCSKTQSLYVAIIPEDSEFPGHHSVCTSAHLTLQHSCNVNRAWLCPISKPATPSSKSQIYPNRCMGGFTALASAFLRINLFGFMIQNLT